MPRKVFVAGEILTAADVNTNLMDQAVMVFDDSAARGSAIPTPSEGMVTYLKDTDSLEQFTGAAFVPVSPPITSGDLPAGTILQVVSTTKTDSFATTSTSFTPATGVSATITPISASSKIFISGMLSVNVRAVNAMGRYRLMRNSTAIAIGDTAGARDRATGSYHGGNSTGADGTSQLSPNFLDSPETTSAVTYSVQIAVDTGFFALNTTHADADLLSRARTASTLTLMEVAG